MRSSRTSRRSEAPRSARALRLALESLVLATLAACREPAAPADAEPDADAGDAACAPFDTPAGDAGDDCATFVTLPCGLPDGATVSLCYPNLAACAEACAPHDILYCVLAPSSCAEDGGVAAGPALVECSACGSGGRRPRDYAPRVGCSRSELGDHFARLACLERASVRAFGETAARLEAFGAPVRLVRAARRAQSDERRHARAMTRLARRFGGVVLGAKRAATRPTTLAHFVEESAVEGCAGESFGALIASWQAVNAPDARLRRTMKRVARDEARHAALAWEIVEWGLPQLASSDRRRVRERLSRALRACGAGGAPSRAVVRGAGLPDTHAARRLAAGLRRIVTRQKRKSDKHVT